MNKIAKLLTIIALGMASFFQSAHAVQIIDFDSLSAGTDVTSQYASQGILFQNAQVFGLVEPGSTPPNTICGATGGVVDCIADITLTFVDPTNSAVMATTDYIESLFVHIQLATNYLEAFDIFGVSLGKVLVPASPTQQVVSFSASGIHSVVLHGLGDVAFDNIQFNDVTVSVSNVPEPTIIALLCIGLVGYGFTRNQKAA